MTIPDQVKAIGSNAFSGCRVLENPYIPAGVKTIGEKAFKDCEKITKVTLPKTVKTIRKQAFLNCKSLIYIVVPSSVQNMGDMIFNDCADDLVVWVEKGSKAEAYCEDNVYDYRYWDGSEPTTETEETKTDIWAEP